jgi:hypothetical protein
MERTILENIGIGIKDQPNGSKELVLVISEERIIVVPLPEEVAKDIGSKLASAGIEIAKGLPPMRPPEVV